MTLYQGVFLGDSETAGTVGSFSVGQGGRGSWFDLTAEALGNLAGIGPILSPGIQITTSTIYGGGAINWTFSGSWTADASTDTYDLVPCGLGIHASGASFGCTWTKPTTMRPIVGVTIVFRDTVLGGDWRYRIDGGSWVNHGQSLLHNDRLLAFHVPTAIASTIEFQASSDGVAAAPFYPFGIVPWYSDPTVATQGIILHNIGQNAQQLHSMVGSVSGDRMRFLDNVALGTGSPMPFDFDFVHCMYINDITLNNTTTWASDLTTFFNRVSPSATVGFTSVWEVPYMVGPTVQANYRAQMKTTGAGLTGVKLHDLNDDWVANGWADNAAMTAAGLLLSSDSIHPANLGHRDLFPRFYWFTRNQLLGLGALPTTYPTVGKQAAVAYNGKQASVAYGAAMPILLV